MLLQRDRRFLLCSIRFYLGDCGFLFLHFAVLFEKLVEQHGVHRFVADGVNLALGIASHQIGVHLFHVLGYETELRVAL